MNFTNTDSVGKVVCKQVAMQVCDQLRCHVWNRWDGQMNVQVHGRGYKQINPIQNTISKEIRK